MVENRYGWKFVNLVMVVCLLLKTAYAQKISKASNIGEDDRELLQVLEDAKFGFEVETDVQEVEDDNQFVSSSISLLHPDVKKSSNFAFETLNQEKKVSTQTTISESILQSDEFVDPSFRTKRRRLQMNLYQMLAQQSCLKDFQTFGRTSFNAVGTIRIYFEDGREKYCTGTLIDDNAVITTADCYPLENNAVMFQYQPSWAQDTVWFTLVAIYIPNKWIENQTNQNFAIFFLENPLYDWPKIGYEMVQQTQQCYITLLGWIFSSFGNREYKMVTCPNLPDIEEQLGIESRNCGEQQCDLEYMDLQTGSPIILTCPNPIQHTVIGVLQMRQDEQVNSSLPFVTPGTSALPYMFSLEDFLDISQQLKTPQSQSSRYLGMSECLNETLRSHCVDECWYQQLDEECVEGDETTTAHFSEYPYMLSLRISRKDICFQHFCGGVLIWYDVVLTSASCIERFLDNSTPTRKFNKNVYITRQSKCRHQNGVQQVLAIEAIIHPNFEVDSQNNDIAIIILQEGMTGDLKFMDFGSSRLNETIMNAKFLGYGHKFEGDKDLDSRSLKIETLKVLPNDGCRSIMQFFGSNSFNETTMICAGGQNISTCELDGGGPMLVQDDEGTRLLGIFSRSLPSQECGAAEQSPSIFTKISFYSDWISEQIRDHSESAFRPSYPNSCESRQNSIGGDYSYYVQISVDDSFFCSGVLVEKNWILTSYSCFQQTSEHTQSLIKRDVQDMQPIVTVQNISQQYYNTNCFDIEYTKTQIKLSIDECHQNFQNALEPEFYVVYDEYEQLSILLQNDSKSQDNYRTIHFNDLLLVKVRNITDSELWDVPRVRLGEFDDNENNYKINIQVQKKELSFPIGQTNVICSQSNFQNQTCDLNEQICLLENYQNYLCKKNNSENYQSQLIEINLGDPLIRQIDVYSNSSDSSVVEIFGLFSNDLTSLGQLDDTSPKFFTFENFSNQNNAIFIGFTKKIINWINTTTSEYQEVNQCKDVYYSNINNNNSKSYQDLKSPEPEIKNRDTTNTIAIIVSVVGFFIMVGVVMVLLLRRRMKKIRERIRGADNGLPDIEMEDFSQIISYEMQQRNNAFIIQSSNWWADIQIPAGVREIPITDLQEVRPLGAGGFALVYEVKVNDKVRKNYSDLCDKHLALKVIYKEYTKLKDQVQAIMQEVNVMKGLDSQHIVQLIGASLYVRPSIVMELVPNGSLKNLLYSDGFKAHETPLQWKLQLILNISKGIQYLHSQGIIHRDLKPDNILIKDKKEPQTKISDFGLSKIKKTKSSISARAGAGTIYYMAPEAFIDNQKITKKVDIWALGVIMQEIIRGVRPWEKKDERYVLCRIASYQEPPDEGELPKESYPKELCSLIQSCWGEASTRPTADEVVNNLDALIQQTSNTTNINNYSRSTSNEQTNTSMVEMVDIQRVYQVFSQNKT